MPRTSDLAARRLHAQRLVGQQFASAVDAVRWFGAVQAQDYGGAKWALGMRTLGATEARVDRLFDDGAILRTHLMRPTWHFVVPEDIRWILALTSPRLLSGLAGRHRRLELDEATMGRSRDLFANALAGGRFLTRTELADVLKAAGISPEGQRMPHLLMVAEAQGVLVSGPRRGKQFTYALLEERVPKARDLDPDEALAELTSRYFTSHGPAQLGDFAWWSGLTVAQGRRGIALAGPVLEQVVVDGRQYWFDARSASKHDVREAAHLLPNFDEYTVAYRDREAVLHPTAPFDPTRFAYYREQTPLSGVLSNVLVIAGHVRGSWRRALARHQVRIELRMLGTLDKTELAAVRAAGERLGDFLGLGVELEL